MTEDVSALAERLKGDDGKALVWGYLRVSTESQEANESLDFQRRDIIAYAQKNKLAEPRFVEEVGSAAKPMFVVNLPGTPKGEETCESSPRPLLLCLMGHLRETPGSTLIVWKVDRLSRLSHEQELFFDLMKKSEIRLHSVQGGEDHILDGGYVRDPARILMRQVMAAYSQYERAMIELRMKTGLTYKAARGGYTGGAPLFGYEVIKGELHPHTHQAAMVRLIFSLSREHKLTLEEITKYINDNKKDDNKYYKNRIWRILQHERMYLGYYKDCFGREHFRPDLKIIASPGDKV